MPVGLILWGEVVRVPDGGNGTLMSTIRSEKTRDFSVISNTVLRDKRLTWEARGLAAYILSWPNHWQMRTQHLMTQVPKGKGGRDKILRILSELEATGYLHRETRKGPDGRFVYEQVLYENPVNAFAGSGKTDFGKTDFGKAGTLLNTDLVITEEVNTEDNITPRKTRRYPFPKGWILTEARDRVAVECGVNDAVRVWELFKAHYEANQIPFANWEAKWKEWCLNQTPPPSSVVPPPHKFDSDRLAEENIKSFLKRRKENERRET